MSDYTNLPYYDLLKLVRERGLVMSKEYAKLTNERFAHLSFEAPALWQAIMSRRYLLPAQLQADYISQPSCDALLLDFLATYSAKGMQIDDIINTTYVCTARAFEFGRQAFYLERHLGQALMRTDVPMDLQMDDVRWVFPAFRLYLPNNMIGITRNEQFNGAMFVDVCRVEQGHYYDLPLPIKKDLKRIFAGYHFPLFEMPCDAFLMITNLHFDCPESNISYAVTAPWAGTTLRDMIASGNHPLYANLVSDDTDKEFMSRVCCLVINVMLHLASLPEASLDNYRRNPQVIRKPKQEGRRSIAGLYAARLIGLSDLPSHQPTTTPIDPTGRHHAAHWVRGHWRRQAYGPKMGLRRLHWIAPYQTYQH